MNGENLYNIDEGVTKFGYNSDVDAAEDVWSGGGDFDWTKVAANATTTIESSSADDDGDPVGTGARTVRVEGLVIETINGVTGGRIYTEDATLNGTTAVTLSNLFAFVYRVQVLTAGSGNGNAGLLSVKHSTDVIARVEIGDNQTEMALMIIPQFTTTGSYIRYAFLRRVYGYLDGNSVANAGVVLQAAPKDTTVFAVKHRARVTVGAPLDHVYTVRPRYSPGQKIRLRVTDVSAINQTISGGFEFKYE
jgi:hypothetical protein